MYSYQVSATSQHSRLKKPLFMHSFTSSSSLCSPRKNLSKNFYLHEQNQEQRQNGTSATNFLLPPGYVAVLQGSQPFQAATTKRSAQAAMEGTSQTAVKQPRKRPNTPLVGPRVSHAAPKEKKPMLQTAQENLKTLSWLLGGCSRFGPSVVGFG